MFQASSIDRVPSQVSEVPGAAMGRDMRDDSDSWGERKKGPRSSVDRGTKSAMLERETVRNPNQSFFGFGMTLDGTGGAGGASSVGLGGAGGAEMTGAAPAELGACGAP